MQSYVEERIESATLDLSYHLEPWDRLAFPGNTATISSIRVGADDGASRSFETFRDWCRRHEVKLVTCRLPHDRLAECGFLEAEGFRFIELNYRPKLNDLDKFVDDSEISICPALPLDAAEISSFAAQVFKTGRFHIDPQIGPEIGRLRYAAWILNAFENPEQQVFKCMLAGRIIAYFVLEQSHSTSVFWSLFGLAPGLAGQGLGRRLGLRAAQAMLAFNRREGVRQVSASISSLNPLIFNLLISLGFRLPPPAITLHWCPLGPVRPSP